MKLKFDQEVQDVIDIVAALPEVETFTVATSAAGNAIGAFEKSINAGRDSKKLPMKHYARLRRQLSFMYEFVLIASGPADKPHNDAQRYNLLVKMFKDIKSGAILKEAFLVKLALRYGVVHLSDHEIQSLIAGNKA